MAPPKEVKYDMIKRLRVADYVTLSNAVCGVLSIFCSMRQQFIAAHVLIFLGYEFDRFDGIVARWMNQCSDWGKELDSFSDMISFVVAPAIMLYTLGFQTAMDQAALVFWVLCGLTRLVRFNVAAHLVPKDASGKALYHEGLATAYATLIISTAVAVSSWLDLTAAYLLPAKLFDGTLVETHTAMIPVLVMSVMMASKRMKLKVDGAWSIPATTVVIFASCWKVAPLEF